MTLPKIVFLQELTDVSYLGSRLFQTACLLPVPYSASQRVTCTSFKGAATTQSVVTQKYKHSINF